MMKGSKLIMKTMKKIFALALTLMLVFSLALTANAAGMTDTGTVKITNAAAGETYTFYRVYDLESVGNGGVIYTTNTKWDTFGEPTYVTISDDNHVTGLESFTNAVAQTFAEAAVAAAKPEDKTAEATTSGVLEVSGLQYGYYVMKSTLGDADKYTVFTLSSTPFAIDEKNETDLPKFEKTVQEDSDSKFGETNDADVGQEITFKLTVTAAAGTDAYSITDNLTNLEFLGITGVTLNGQTITEGFEVNPISGGNTFTVTFTDTFRKTLKDNDLIEITYTAKLTAAAITAGEGSNEAVFTYGDNVEIEDNTETKTYKITVTKTDDNENKEQRIPLSGATFVLKKGDLFYKYDETNGVTWVTNQADATPKTSDAKGVLVFEGIDADDYTLVEIDAPDGYVLPTAGENVTVDGNKEVAVTNTLGEKLPETGGMGTTLFYTVGGLMVVAAVVLLVSKKRMGAM